MTDSTAQKALAFTTAMLDIYRDEESRELDAFGKAEISDDVTEDFTAMLLAMRFMYERMTGDEKSDIIDFTHILNKLAVQYIMESRGAGNG